MTEQEMETVVKELEEMFNQPANEKPWHASDSGIDFNRHHTTFANQTTEQFEHYFSVGIWHENVLVSTIGYVNQWEAFKVVARIITLKLMTGEQLQEASIDPNNDPTYANRMLMNVDDDISTQTDPRVMFTPPM